MTTNAQHTPYPSQKVRDEYRAKVNGLEDDHWDKCEAHGLEDNYWDKRKALDDEYGVDGPDDEYRALDDEYRAKAHGLVDDYLARHKLLDDAKARGGAA